MIATKKEQPMGWIVLDKGNLAHAPLRSLLRLSWEVQRGEQIVFTLGVKVRWHDRPHTTSTGRSLHLPSNSVKKYLHMQIITLHRYSPNLMMPKDPLHLYFHVGRQEHSVRGLYREKNSRLHNPRTNPPNHRNLRTRRRMHLCMQYNQMSQKFMGLASSWHG
jgi:hypothetical protein